MGYLTEEGWGKEEGGIDATYKTEREREMRCTDILAAVITESKSLYSIYILDLYIERNIPKLHRTEFDLFKKQAIKLGRKSKTNNKNLSILETKLEHQNSFPF